MAFREAIALQVDAIELDVHLTVDGGLVVIHDPTVDRTSDGTGRVGEMTLDQILELDAGSWFHERFRGEKFLEFGSALDLLPPEIRLNVHVKAGDEDRGVLVSLVVEELTRRRMLEQAFVASDEATLRAVLARVPDLAICNLSTQPVDTYVSRSLDLGCRILQPGNAMTDAHLVDAAHVHGMEVNPFYADDEEEMHRLIQCGVDGILTNFPQRLQNVLERV